MTAMTTSRCQTASGTPTTTKPLSPRRRHPLRGERPHLPASFVTAVTRVPVGAPTPAAPRPARYAPLPTASAAINPHVASAATSPTVSAVASAEAPRHANDEAAQAIARLFGGLDRVTAAQRLSTDVGSVSAIFAMGSEHDAYARLSKVMDRAVAAQLAATAVLVGSWTRS